MTKTILVTGGTGNIGSYLIPDLIKGGATVRVLVRDTTKASKLSDLGAELYQGSFSDQDALNAAVSGVDAVMAITPAGAAAVIQGEALLKGALSTGSPYYVRLSAIGADPDAPTENGKLHYESDKALMESGLSYTILRPHFFMQNLFVSVDTIKVDGNMYWGMGNGKLGMVDVRDISDCCVSLLLNGGHHGQIFTPTGPTTITFGDIAEIIAKDLNKPVNYVPISIEAVGDAIRKAGWGEWGAQVMMDYSKAYAEGWGDFVNDDVKTLTGHKARSFQDFYDQVLSHAIQ